VGGVTGGWKRKRKGELKLPSYARGRRIILECDDVTIGRFMRMKPMVTGCGTGNWCEVTVLRSLLGFYGFRIGMLVVHLGLFITLIGSGIRFGT
jgi:hypothetical protein